MAASRNILKRQTGAFVSFVFVPSYICCLESGHDGGHLDDNNGGHTPGLSWVRAISSPGPGNFTEQNQHRRHGSPTSGLPHNRKYKFIVLEPLFLNLVHDTHRNLAIPVWQWKHLVQMTLFYLKTLSPTE